MNRETRGLLIVLGVLVLLVLLMPLFGGGMMGPGMMWGYGQPGQPGQPGWSWGLGMGLGLLAMLAFWGVLIVGLVLLVRWLAGTGGGGGGGPRGEPPVETLKRRYAAGEVDREEYERMRQELER